MMKKFLITLLLVISMLGFTQVGNEQEAKAADMGRFNPGRIIDDRIFTDTSTMNVAQIQYFLDNVNGRGSTCLKNYVTDKPLGSNQYGGPVSAAQAIYDVSQLYGLNPQVILVTLQKEQGSITSTSCPERVYKTAMGFGCPDTAPCDAQWFGLSKQLFQGARHLKGFYSNSLQYVPFKVGTYYVGWHPNGGCGGTYVNIQTRGTAALYSYTPYQPNAAALASSYGSGNSCSSYGNRNFFSYFSDWFGSPSGDMVRTVANGTVYLLGNNIKYAVGTQAILADYGILGPVNFVDQGYLDGVPTGSNLTRMVGSTDVNNGSLYLIVAGIKLPFTSCGQVADYGFSCASVNRLAPTQLAMFANGPHVTSLLKSTTNATVYYIKDGKKQPIPSWFDLEAIGSGTGINWLTDSLVDSIPTGDLFLSGGSLVKTADSGTVYAVNDWKDSPSLFPVTSFNTTMDLGLGAYVRTISNAQLAKYDISTILKSTVKCGANTYVGTNGVLYQLNPDQYSHFGYSTQTFIAGGDICRRFTISQTQMSRFILNSGTIYLVENGTKRGFTSYAAFLANGGASSPVLSVSGSFANSLPTGQSISS